MSAAAGSTTGPNLETYVETRFNLLTESLKDLAAAHSGALGSAIEALKSAQQAADVRYQQRFEAQSQALTAALQAATEATQAALTAVKDQTKSAFEASEKAIEKSDANQEKWRANANEWRAAMVDRESRFAARAEVENELKSIRLEIASLKESRDVTAGRQKWTDPAIAQMVEEVKALRAVTAEARGVDPFIARGMEDIRATLATLAQSQAALAAAQAGSTGKSQGASAVWAAIAVGVGLLVGMIGLGFSTLRDDPAPPSVIFAPAPAGTLLPSSPPSGVPR